MKPATDKGMYDKFIRLWLILMVLPFFSYPQNPEKQGSFLFNGYAEDMQGFIFQDINKDLITSNLIHNRLNFKWLISTPLTASLEMRNRFLTGNMLSAYPGYRSTVQHDGGILNLSKNLIDQNSMLLNSTIDRLWLQYAQDKFQITAGRQRVNWGQTLVWNPNDIFNSYSYFDFDYIEKPGSDAVRFQYFSGPASVIEFAAKLNYLRQLTFAGLYRFNKWNYDIQFLLGMVDQSDLMVGCGWSGQILKGGFRGEASYFHPRKNIRDSTGVFVSTLGYDYTFKNSLSLQLEVLYNSNQSKKGFLSDQFIISNISAKNPFIPGYSVFCSIAYPITPLVNISLAGIDNPGNDLIFIIPTLTISVLKNLDLSFIAQIMRNTMNRKSGEDLNLVFARLKFSF